jgi:hypothetical protein
MAFAKLEILLPQGGHLRSSKAAADEKRQQGTIAPTPQSVVNLSCQQALALFRCQPISDTHSQPFGSLDPMYPSGEIGTKQTGISGLISQVAYRS